jgi:DNA-binding NtrC family response regulator
MIDPNADPILLVDGNEHQREELLAILRERFAPRVVGSLEDIQEAMDGPEIKVVIFDLDFLVVDGRQIKELKKRYPDTYLLLLSSRPFHPELQEVMATDVYACLRKPVDPEELFYWLRSILKR